MRRPRGEILISHFIPYPEAARADLEDTFRPSDHQVHLPAQATLNSTCPSDQKLAARHYRNTGATADPAAARSTPVAGTQILQGARSLEPVHHIPLDPARTRFAESSEADHHFQEPQDHEPTLEPLSSATSMDGSQSWDGSEDSLPAIPGNSMQPRSLRFSRATPDQNLNPLPDLNQSGQPESQRAEPAKSAKASGVNWAASGSSSPRERPMSTLAMIATLCSHTVSQKGPSKMQQHRQNKSGCSRRLKHWVRTVLSFDPCNHRKSMTIFK